MSVKSNSTDKSDSSDKNSEVPGFQGTPDPELEKKVDDMLSEDRPVGGDTDAKKSGKKSKAKDEAKVVEPAGTPAEESGVAGAPLLPTEELPDLDKKDENAEEPEETSGFISPRDEVPADTEPLPPTVPAEPVPPAAPVEPAAATPPATTEELPDDLGLEDVSTGKAVDEIVSEEADELLAAHDKAKAQETLPAKPKDKKSFKKFLAAWWHNKLARNATLAVLFLGVAAALAIPGSRYFILNSAGVRSSASITVLDETTNQPLKNAEFSLAGQSAKTDGDGNVRLLNLKLGKSTMTVHKTAFADYSQPVTVGWGSNPLGEYKLKAVGSQYTFHVSDFASKKPIVKAEAISGEASARSNDKGEIVLTVPQTDKDKIDVQIVADNYRTENLSVPVTQKEVLNLGLVPSRKHVFISKREGTYDVYKIDADGKNEDKVLAGTGREQLNTLALSPHPTKNIAALVSSRDTATNDDGYLLHTLTIIDLSDNETTKVTSSERIQLVDWIGDKLIFVRITEGASAASKDRHKLVSYDLDTSKETLLAETNYFNDVISANGSIYYSPASYNVNGSVGLYKINAEGNDRNRIYDKEVWNLFRTSYDKISVSMGQEWFELNLDNDAMSKSSAPSVLKSRVYVDSPDKISSLWVDDRDGKGTLLNYIKESHEDKVLQAVSGLKTPVRWLDNKHIVYRVTNASETADYLLNTDGGQPIKIRDVTDTAGIDRWYYY